MPHSLGKYKRGSRYLINELKIRCGLPKLDVSVQIIGVSKLIPGGEYTVTYSFYFWNVCTPYYPHIKIVKKMNFECILMHMLPSVIKTKGQSPFFFEVSNSALPQFSDSFL